MGIFLTVVTETHFAGTHIKNRLVNKVINYILYNLRDESWQDSISSQTRTLVGHHRTLSIFLRFFYLDEIEKGNLKSYAKYVKKDDKLVIDQMLVLNDYVNLEESAMRVKISNDILEYLKTILLKYKDRFQDFDVITFIPLLEERMDKIKLNEFSFDYYENTQIAKKLNKLAEAEEQNL